MDEKTFQKQGIGKVPLNIINFCPAAQQHPEQKQQYQGKNILIPGFFMVF
jgi:hypothetical protein